MKRACPPLAWLVLPLLTIGCGSPRTPPARAAPASESLDYDRDELWMCRGGLSEDDACLSHDLTATEVLPDGSLREVPHEVADAPAYDCFYLYPTVAFQMATGSDSEWRDRARVRDPLLRQAARFTGQCRVFAPLYRQATLLSYTVATEQERRQALERAYADVEAAFRHYVDHHRGGRPFVVLGHSQGAHMGRRLVARLIARDSGLRSDMIAALLIGGDVLVAEGHPDGGNTGGVPLCSGEDPTGCIVAYRTYAAGAAPPPGAAHTVIDDVPAGLVPACTNPAKLAGGDTRLRGSFFPTHAHQRAYDPWQGKPPAVDTPFVLYRDLYTAECVRDGAGFPYLRVEARGSADGDVRDQPLPLDENIYSAGILGLHLVDYDLALGDLMALTQQMSQ